MILSILVVCVIVPIGFIFSDKFGNFLESLGMKTSPNFNDGYVVVEGEDPGDDLLRPLPGSDIYKHAATSLDLRKFSVKKVRFNPLSGVGIAPRVNLVFEFDGKLPNLYELKSKFSFPVIHVFIDDHSKVPGKSQPNKARFANIDSPALGWDYQVVIDGLHDQARIFDPGGELLGHGLGLYLNYIQEKHAAPVTQSKAKPQPQTPGQAPLLNEKTRITAGLPLKLLGDPAKGEWSFYIFIGLVDLGNPTMMFTAEGSAFPEVFDYSELKVKNGNVLH